MNSKENNRLLKKTPQALSQESQDTEKLQFNIREESLHVSLSEHRHTHNVNVSDLPSPEVFDAYSEKLQNLILKRIETDIENDKSLIDLEAKEQSIRHFELSGEIRLKSRGQIFAFISLLLLLGSSVYFASIGAYKLAGTVVGVTIVGAISAFSGFSSSLKEKQKEKKKD